MRIAVFVPSLRGGGAERVMLDLAHGFAERGIATDLVLPQVEGPYLSEVRTDVRIVNLAARRVLASLPAGGAARVGDWSGPGRHSIRAIGSH